MDSDYQKLKQEFSSLEAKVGISSKTKKYLFESEPEKGSVFVRSHQLLPFFYLGQKKNMIISQNIVSIYSLGLDTIFIK